MQGFPQLTPLFTASLCFIPSSHTVHPTTVVLSPGHSLPKLQPHSLSLESVSGDGVSRDFTVSFLPFSSVEVLSPSISECDCIWR